MDKQLRYSAFPTKLAGFTLMELVVVAAVVGILFAIAFPSYQNFIQTSRRSDATVALRAIQFAQEKYRANNTSYGTLTQLAISSATESGYYTLDASGLTGTGYTLTATAVNGTTQASDSGCTTLTLQQSGTTLTPSPSSCWTK